MRYLSTRDTSLQFQAEQTIVQGLSRDGGLFTPESLPVLAGGAIDQLRGMTYQQRAVHIMSMFLDNFSSEELTGYAQKAYEGFDSDAVAPVYSVDGKTHFLELWHGPTCAFKDMALQMLPYLLTASLKKTGENKTACILVATSGDTGKAALEGFKDVPGTKILVFYPKDGVSQIQQLQMTTQEGGNVGVCAVVGNFDDTQTGVKALFSDPELRERLEAKQSFLSSANSINWGRVLPQIPYYVSAYCDLLNRGAVEPGKPFNVCVPTGNFGNILSAYYAKQMGIPISRLICASNSNNVLTDFFRSGSYDKNRRFFTTTSPSMDILISSNLERLLFHLSGGNDAEVRGYMDNLSKTGFYTASQTVKEALSDLFYAGYCDDTVTARRIKEVYEGNGYLIDTHTAVAYDVLEQYRRDSGDNTAAVVVSTASPYKFCDSVLSALGVLDHERGVSIIGQLSDLTGTKAPAPLTALRDKEVRFTQVVEKDDMIRAVNGMLT